MGEVFCARIVEMKTDAKKLTIIAVAAFLILDNSRLILLSPSMKKTVKAQPPTPIAIANTAYIHFIFDCP
jgi:predicted branched-subunit amino acid permease